MKIPDIKDVKLRKAVEEANKYYSGRLKSLPATFSGHNHPQDERGYGGLEKHIKRMFWFFERCAEEFQWTSETLDMFYVASYFHDLSKCDYTNQEKRVIITNEKETKREIVITRDGKDEIKHPFFSATLAERFLNGAKVDIKITKKITRMIQCHMEHWYPKTPLPLTEDEKLFALGDFIVSRSDCTIEL